MPPRIFVIAALVLLAFLLATNIYRASHQSITIDEAFTYTSHLAVKNFWMFPGDIPNNHALHTLLCKLSITLFGLSELTLRLPSLLGGLIYFIGLFRLSRFLFGRGIWFLLSIALNSLNPLILDYLSAARGYGLGLGFFTWGLYYLLRFVTRAPDSDSAAIKAGAAAGLAAAAQLTYIPPAIAIGAVAILLTRQWRASFRMVATAAAVACAILAWPMRHATRADFYIGLPSFKESLDSLVEASLLYKQRPFAGIPFLRAIFVDSFEPLLAIATLALLLLWLLRGKPQPALRVILGGSLLWYVLLRAAAFTLARPFPPNRAGLYIVVLVSLSFLLALQGLEQYRILTAVGALALSAYVVQYAMQYNTGYYLLHQRDTATRKVFEIIRESRAANRGVQVGSNWLFHEDLEFYRDMYHADWMEPVSQNMLDCYYDYYVLLPDDAASLASRYGLQQLYRDRSSEAILMKPSNALHPAPAGACGVDAAKLTAFARFEQPGAKSHVAFGMVEGHDLWSFNRVLMFFRPGDAATFRMRFDIHETIFDHTGPITMSILINGRQFTQRTYDKVGEHTFEQKVPPEFLAPITAVDLRMDKYYLSPGDGAKLDLWLHEAGFIP